LKILIIEDDIGTCEVMRLSLEIFDPDSTLTIAEKGLIGLEKVHETQFDIVVLDLGLPDIDGLEVLRKIRAFSQIPVLVASARHEPEIITGALNAGAQDYVLKPFNFQIFLDSLRDLADASHLLRNDSTIIQITNRFSVKCNSREAQLDGVTITLDTNEWLILECFINHWGRLVPINLLNEIISDSDSHSNNNQLVNQTVNRLRKKIGDDIYNSTIILSEFSCGYRLIKPRNT
jgi:two-component system KDP operon response regulator KdpE